MSSPNKRSWTLVGAFLGTSATLALVVGLGVLASKDRSELEPSPNERLVAPLTRSC